MSVTVDIRPAQLSDIVNCINLLREFQEESLGEYGFEVKAEQAKKLVEQYIDSSLVAVCNNKIIGVIAGSISIFPLDGSRIYQEAVWYVSKQYRFCGVALLNTLEMYCKKWGVSHIVMVHMCNLKSEKLGKFYSAMKYKELEKHYIKTLGA